MIRKCHNHRANTIPWHREEGTQNTISHSAAKKKKKKKQECALTVVFVHQRDDLEINKYKI